jgi:hypothetical protein
MSANPLQIARAPLIPADTIFNTTKVTTTFPNNVLGSYTTWKLPVIAATTTNISLFGSQLIDGVSVQNGDRVLVFSQTNQVENGIYVVADQWQRSNDMQSGTSASASTVFVNQGIMYGEKLLTCTNDIGLDIVGVNGLVFQLVAGVGIGFPAPPNQSVQYNNLGVFGGSDLFTYTTDIINRSVLAGIGIPVVETSGTITLGPLSNSSPPPYIVGNLTGQSAVSSNDSGGTLLITGGDGNGSGQGGTCVIAAGTPGTSGDGGDVFLVATNATTGAGGDIAINAGTTQSGTSGNVIVNAGSSDSTTGGTIQLMGGQSNTGQGGYVSINGGGSFGTQVAGAVDINGGNASGNADGAYVSIVAGSTVSTGGNHGGAVVITSGSTSGNGNSGFIMISSADMTGPGASGDVTMQTGTNTVGSIGQIKITGGIPSGNFDGGPINIQAGNTNAVFNAITPNSGGQINIIAGSSNTGANGGQIHITAGSGGSYNPPFTVRGSGGDLIFNAGFTNSIDSTDLAGDLTFNAGQSLNGRGGSVGLQSGSSQNGSAGDININGGSSALAAGSISISGGASSTDNGGTVSIQGGYGGFGGGSVIIECGACTSAGPGSGPAYVSLNTPSLSGAGNITPGGAIYLWCGNTVDGNAGSVFIYAGDATGTGAPGNIVLRTYNTAAAADTLITVTQGGFSTTKSVVSTDFGSPCVINQRQGVITIANSLGMTGNTSNTLSVSYNIQATDMVMVSVQNWDTSNLGAPFANIGIITSGTGFILNIFNTSSSSIASGTTIQVAYLII